MLLTCGAGELLRVPWTARRSNQSIIKEINPYYSLKGLMLKLQYLGHLMQTADSLERIWCWERLKAERATEDEIVVWHHRVNGHELGQTSGDGEGQGGLACCCSWGHRESDATWRLNNNDRLSYDLNPALISKPMISNTKLPHINICACASYILIS